MCSAKILISLLCFVFSIINVHLLNTTTSINIFSNCAEFQEQNSTTLLLLPNCTIKSKRGFRVECLRNSKVEVWPFSFSVVDNQELEISCVCEVPMHFSTVMQNGVPRYYKESTCQPRIQRFAENISDFDTYKYYLTFHHSGYNNVRDSIQSAFGEITKVLPLTITVFLSGWTGGAGWMGTYYGENTAIEVTDESILIPMVQDSRIIQENSSIYKIKHLGPNETLIPIPLDNLTLAYVADEGLYLNTTLMPDYAGHYKWMTPDTESAVWTFQITDIPDLEVTPVLPRTDKVMRIFTTKAVSNPTIKLICNYIDKISLTGILSKRADMDVGWLLDDYWSNPETNFKWIVADAGDHVEFPENVNDYNPEEIDITNETVYKQQHLPKSRYIGTYEGSLEIWDRLEVNCTRESDGKVLYTWRIQVHDVELRSDPYLWFEDNSPIYYPNQPEGDPALACYSTMYADIRLRAIQCNNIYDCKFKEECFNEDYYCNNLVIEGHRCPNSMGVSPRYCQQSHARSPGEIVLCTGGGHSYKQIYFLGFDDKIYNYYSSTFPSKALMQLRSSNLTQRPWPKLFINEIITFTCEVHQFFSEGNLIFEIMNLSGGANRSEPKIQSKFIQHANDTVPYSETITVLPKSSMHFGITCLAPLLFSATQWVASNVFVLEIHESIPPTILTKDTERFFEFGALDIALECKVSGEPTPSISWTRINTESPETLDVIQTSNDTSILKFGKFSRNIEGVYKCIATNIAGSASRNFIVREKEDFTLVITIGSVGIGVVLLSTLATTLYLRYKNSKIPEVQLSEDEVNEFLNGATNSNSGTQTGANQLPFKKEFEIKREEIEFTNNTCLGEGEFGEVYLGKLTFKDEPVAFKTTKPNCPPLVFKALLQELKIMSYLGAHENVVSLIGAYIAEIKNGVLYIAMEFCENMSMQDYLQRNAEQYEKVEQLEFSGLKSEYQCANAFERLGFQDLIRWSKDVASGMEFLSNKKIVHLDLAARNILLTASLTAKISDFGLSRRLYEKLNYVKIGKEPLPWRHLAIECLETNTYSTFSDVWAYGILLWEIFSLGTEPFPGLSWTIEFANQLKFGLRNLKPSRANDEIYDLMKECWREIPEERPSFTTILKFFKETPWQKTEHYSMTTRL